MDNKLPPRLTVEEVNEFDPSIDNPMEVISDTSYLEANLQSIKIASRAHNNRVVIMDTYEGLDTIATSLFRHFPSQKKSPTKMVQFYQAIAHDKFTGLLTIGNILVTKNYKLSDGGLLRDGERVLRLIPVCELEMPIEFEE